MKALNRIFNWKEYPDGVLYIAMPLAFLGLLCSVAVSYLYYQEAGSWLHPVTVIVGLIVLAVDLKPALPYILETIYSDPRTGSTNHDD